MGAYQTGAHAAPHTFDALFAKYAGAVPVPYLRALSWHESGSNPNAKPAKPWFTDAKGRVRGPGVGILQITPIVLADFNRRHSTALTETDLYNPELNIAMGCGVLNAIVTSYAHHAALAMDWRSARYVELVTFGWNAGYSEGAGVGHVVGAMEAAQVPAAQITIETVSQAAASLPGTSHNLTSAAKVKWCKGVTVAYFRELGATAQGGGINVGEWWKKTTDQLAAVNGESRPELTEPGGKRIGWGPVLGVASFGLGVPLLSSWARGARPTRRRRSA